jgi:hypothetical protein
VSAADRDFQAGDITTLGLTWAARQLPGIFAGPRNVRDNERAALLAAGYQYGRWAGENNPPGPIPDKGKWVPVWYDPVAGRTFGRSEAVAIAGQIRAQPVTQAPPVDRPPPILTPPVPYEPPPNRPPPYNPPPWNRGPPAAPPPGGGGFPPIVGTIDIGKVLEQLGKWNDLLTGGLYTAVFGNDRPIPKGPTNPRGPRTAPPGRGDPFPPSGAPPQVIVIREQPPAPRETAAEGRASRRRAAMEGLGGIYVSKKRLPMPAPVPPRAPTLPKWMQLLQLALPLLPLLRGGATTNVRFADPLTQPPFEEPQLGWQPDTNNFFGGDFGGGAVGTNTCECKAPRKKRRKRKRKVCYTGRFTETATGISKYSKREVPCK